MNETLTKAVDPIGHYKQIQIVGDTIELSGCVAVNSDGSTITGSLGEHDLDVEQGYRLAWKAAERAVADLTRVVPDAIDVCVVSRLRVYVASAPGFFEHHLVANGASDFLHKALGHNGLGSRTTVGVVSLPAHAPVEVEITLVSAK